SEDLDQLVYGNIENIEFNEDILTINTVDGNIEINGLDQDSGKYIISFVKKMIERIKPQIDAESMDKIQKAKDLLEIGAIDEAEFENIKGKILEKK
ncbi:MAG: SHOCT domain-containing protein, partial [Methanobacterium sp.]